MKTLYLVVVMVFFAGLVRAETYIWEDEKGTVNFSDDLGNVPKKYRKKVRILGEAEAPLPVVQGEPEKPAGLQQPVVSQGSSKPESRESAVPAAKPTTHLVYGGKEATVWKSEFSAVNGDLKAAEGELVASRKRLQECGGMVRCDYIAVQQTVRSAESRVLELRRKLGDLRQEAGQAGVPAELME